MSIVLFAVWLQGSYHHFVWLLILLSATLGGELFAKAGADALLSRVSIAAAAAIVAPAIVLSQTVVLNGIAVLFPAWSTLGSSRARGIDAMGQRLVMLAGILLTLLLSLLPGAIVAVTLQGEDE